MATSQWNWSWVQPKESTLKSSNSVIQSGGTLYTYRAASRGQLSAQELKSSLDSVATNINQQWSLWRTQIRPILDSLPAGTRDERWRPGTGLPDKIDALSYGLQGTTLFVFNDATSSNGFERYWDSTDERPKTISEAIEDIWTAIEDLDVSSTTTTTSVGLDDLWAAVGHHYQDSSLTSLSSSLDARTNQLESNVNQLAADIYGSLTGGYGSPLLHSIAKNLDEILKIHNVTSGWQADPTAVSHSGVTASAHVHPYSEIRPMLSTTLTLSRSASLGSPTSIADDIKRLRYEIQRTRFGSLSGPSATWQSDPSDPVSGTTDGDLTTHMNYLGTAAAATSTNPHRISYVQTGAETVFTAMRAFTGMSSNADSSPTYSSTTYITNGQSLETSLGALDAAVTSISASVSMARYDMSNVDRSSMSETDRANTPITVTHNIGRIPIIQVLDRSPDEYDYYGQYSSPAVDINLVHIDIYTAQVWTEAAIVDIICIG